MSQEAWARWQYADGQSDNEGNFTFWANVWETAPNEFAGNAVLTGYAAPSDSSDNIPDKVSVLITFRPRK